VAPVRALVENAVEAWPQRPEIISDSDEKWRAFGEADAALCASGTVSLELALAGVPLVSCYGLDWLERQLTFLITAWSASLPNLIADRPVVPEFYDPYLRPQNLARYMETLLNDTPLRQWQRDGFAEVERRLSTSRPSGEIAAEAVVQAIERRKREGS